MISILEFPYSEALFGTPTLSDVSLKITGPPLPPSIPVSIQLTPPMGDPYSIGYTHLKVVERGTNEAVVESDEPNSPIKLFFKFIFEAKEIEIKASMKSKEMDARAALGALLFFKCLDNGPRVTIIDLRTKVVVSDVVYPAAGVNTDSDGIIDLVKKILVVQEKTGTKIIIPRRSFTNDEVDEIETDHELITAGCVSSTCPSCTAIVAAGSPDVLGLLAGFASNSELMFRITRDESYKILGTHVVLTDCVTSVTGILSGNY
jgi:hypothetical protein